MIGWEPQFLERRDIDALHRESLRRFGGSEGVRDHGLVESALGSAQNSFFCGGGDAFDLAAAYAFHIAETQAYLDGNKRAALGAALLFLDLNGHQGRSLDQGRLYDAMIAISDHRMDKAGLAGLFRELFRPGC